MTSATQLINFITNNDYETLEKLIIGKKKVDWNGKDRKGNNAIRKAVEVRAKECFDLLLDNNVMSLSDPYNSGFTEALEYFSNAPNMSNRYYLNKYIGKKASIDLHLIENLILKINLKDHSDIVYSLLDSIDINNYQIESFIRATIDQNNFEAFKFVNEYILERCVF
jgi:hypothetical protein